MDWGTVYLSKKKGGLGIGRIAEKNYALLAKWFWRFSRDSGSLWKKLLCAKYGLGLTDLFLRFVN